MNRIVQRVLVLAAVALAVLCLRRQSELGRIRRVIAELENKAVSAPARAGTGAVPAARPAATTRTPSMRATTRAWRSG